MMEDRDKYIEELNSFVQKCDEKLTSVVSSLGWSMSSITEKTDEMVVCPFFASHRVPVRTLERHLENCQWKAEGYTKNDIPFSEPHPKLNNSHSIVFDEDLQSKVLLDAKAANPSLKIGLGEQLIPRTSDRLFSDFTTDERKILYDYVVSNTVKPEIGNDIGNLNESTNFGSNETSVLEQAAQERDLKRRRARYRGVHTNKKSHIEIMREVITQQMEMFVEHKQKNGNFSTSENAHKIPKHKKEEERSHYQKSRNSKEFEYERRRDELKSKHRHRSSSRSRQKSVSKHRSRSRSRSRGNHKKRKHSSKERKEKRKKRSRSKERSSKHKSKKHKRMRSRS